MPNRYGSAMAKFTNILKMSLSTFREKGIVSLSDCNGNRTHNHLVRKRKLNHLAKLGKRLNCVVRTYLYGAFDCVFLSNHW